MNRLTGVLRKVDAAGAQVPAALLDTRSAGVKDLGYGYTVDEEWLDRDPEEVFADATRTRQLVERHPEHQELVARIISLYSDITARGLENEKQQ